jgi:hypothetical protein
MQLIAAPIPLFGDREADWREAAAELTAVCTPMRESLEPLERQVYEVFHRIVHSRANGLVMEAALHRILTRYMTFGLTCKSLENCYP